MRHTHALFMTDVYESVAPRSSPSSFLMGGWGLPSLPTYFGYPVTWGKVLCSGAQGSNVSPLFSFFFRNLSCADAHT